MHAYVHCSNVYNRKDLEPTQMPINDTLDQENVAHIHHGILCRYKKGWVHVLYRDMDKAGNHHPQQTDTRTENETPHILTHSGWWKMRTHGHREGSTKHWGLLGEKGEGWWEEEVGRYSLRRNAWLGDRVGMETANHYGMYVPMQQSCRIQDGHMFPGAQIQLKKIRHCF